jgi:hypothetical protein
MFPQNKDIKLGIVGLSIGNGHPYSWSAIFNGYDEYYMQNSPFPVIYDYLRQQDFPRNCIHGAKVTHIWCDKKEDAIQVSKATFIPNIVDNLEDLIGRVDAVLLARDDAENHLGMSLPFLKSGIPIFIDKPIAYDRQTAKSIFDAALTPNHIFTCSSLRFAQEFILTENDRAHIGKIGYIHAMVPKSWLKYSVHVIEPIYQIIGFDKSQTGIRTSCNKIGNNVFIEFNESITCSIQVVEKINAPISITVCGESGNKVLVFTDSFNAFKASLLYFLDVLKGNVANIPVEETLKIVNIIENGKQNKSINDENL